MIENNIVEFKFKDIKDRMQDLNLCIAEITRHYNTSNLPENDLLLIWIAKVIYRLEEIRDVLPRYYSCNTYHEFNMIFGKFILPIYDAVYRSFKNTPARMCQSPQFALLSKVTISLKRLWCRNNT